MIIIIIIMKITIITIIIIYTGKWPMYGIIKIIHRFSQRSVETPTEGHQIG